MKIDSSADYYEDSGITGLLDELDENLPKYFFHKNYGNNNIRIFFVVCCSPKFLKVRKIFNKKDQALYRK
jgi:hypothetical protein